MTSHLHNSGREWTPKMMCEELNYKGNISSQMQQMREAGHILKVRRGWYKHPTKKHFIHTRRLAKQVKENEDGGSNY
jgi:hypothetical protein